jgi:hypothetical protein
LGAPTAALEFHKRSRAKKSPGTTTVTSRP